MNNLFGSLRRVFNFAEPAVRTASSPYEKLHNLEEHAHAPSKVYPTLANGILVESGAAWVLGAFVEIVPASTITSPFDVHYVHVEDITANDTLELVLYAGAGDTEIGRIRLTQNAVQDAIVNVPFQSPIVAANSRIRAKVASASGGTDCTISIKYHEY